MKRLLLTGLLFLTFPVFLFAQHANESENRKQLLFLQDSLKKLGKDVVNSEIDVQRKSANVLFIKTLVTALKVPNSFLFPFDSVKTISIVNSPDNKFRVFSWPIVYDDGSYRFYGAVQINTGGSLKIFPLEDYSPLLKNPEDSVTDNRKWYGAEYYSIIPVYGASPYYVLLGWKGNTDRSTKKVIDVISFKNDKLLLGDAVFEAGGKTRNRVIFEYNRQASMLLRYVPDQHLIVFDNLVPPDKKSKDKPEAYGPDLTYNGYRLKNGRWEFVNNLDMRNVASNSDAKYIDPKAQDAEENQAKPVQKKPQ